MSGSRILVIDDEPGICLAMKDFLEEDGAQVSISATAEEALATLDTAKPEMIFMDIRLPGLSGLEAIKQIKEKKPTIPIVLMTAYGTIQTAVEALKQGAFEYLIKPLDLAQVQILVEQALKKRKPTPQEDISKTGTEHFGSLAIIGQSLPMQQVFKQIAYAVTSDANILIQGESGTGKELVARAIHEHSTNRDGPYSIVNCATLTDSIFESELYGHEQGAYTGANRVKIGKVEMAEGGTLFLDEIGEIPFPQQAKLLRFIETKTFERVGGNTTKKIEARFISATNQDLQQQVKAGTFRQDLFYRLNAHVIQLPPLRERKEDLPLLIKHFLQNSKYQHTTLEAKTLAILQRYSWPGNVRELKNIIEQAALVAGTLPISSQHFPSYLTLEPKETSTDEIAQIVQKVFLSVAKEYETDCFEPVMAKFEEALLRYSLKEANGNQSQVARKLGLHRTTLRNKIKQYNL